MRQGISKQREHASPRSVAELSRALLRERQRIDAVYANLDHALMSAEKFDEIRRGDLYTSVFAKAAPLVSVLVPTSDSCDTLVNRCLASIRVQTYKNLQIIVVGDHCTDGTTEALAKTRDTRIQYVNLPERGPYPRDPFDRWRVAGTAPVNCALTMVEGDFVTYLDDDDEYLPTRIEKLLGVMQTNHRDLVWHPFYWRQPDGSFKIHGNGNLELAQLGLGMIMHHAFFAAMPHDVYAHRKFEPGDWNYIRRLKALNLNAEFCPEPLMRYHANTAQRIRRNIANERFIW